MAPDELKSQWLAWVIAGGTLISVAAVLLWGRYRDGKQQARIRSLTDRFPQPMLVVDDSSGRIVYANPAAGTLYGYSSSEWHDLRLDDLRRPNDLPVQSNAALGVETWNHRRKCGRPLILEVLASIGGLPDAGCRCFALRDVTELSREAASRLETEESLRISEARYRRLVEGIDIISWELSLPEFCFNFVSESAERLLGYPVSAWYQPDFWIRTVHPADLKEAMEFCQQRTEQGEDHTFEYRMLAADGRHVWMRDMVTVVKEGGKAVSLRGALVDITSEKLALEELATEKHRYLAIVDAHPDLICRFTPDCTLTFVNDAYATFFGNGDANALLGRKFTEFIEPDQRAAVEEYFLGLAAMPRTPEIEEQDAIGSSGEVRRFSWFNSAVRVSDGRCEEFQGVGRDITALRQAQTAVARRDAIMRTIAATATTLMSAPQWHETVPTLLEQLGCAASAACLCLAATDDDAAEGFRLVGHWAATPHDSDPDQIAVLNRLAATTVESRVPVIQGRLLGVPVMTGRTVWGFLAAAASPTRPEWTEGEVDALRSFTGLVSGFIQRESMTSELKTADEQLRQSQKLEAVGQLASGVAHDFNNLLTAIQGYVGLAKSTLPHTHPAVESLEQVEEASRQATGVANALLTFTRRGKGQRRAVELLAVIEPAIRLLRRTLPANIAIRIEPGRGATWVDGDATQLQQVILNLTINARDAMPKGGTIQIRIENPSPTEAAIVVADDGAGMTAPVRTRVFEPFFTTKPKGTGTGLGLSIVHGIVAEHGGTVSLQSAPGEGSVFRVSLPTVPPPTEPSPDAAPLRRLMRGDVLVVEDDQLVRGLVCSMLSALGYGVVPACNAAEADAFVRSGREFAAVLIDVELPDHSGSELLAEWRNRGHLFPAVVVTGHTHTPIPETPNSRTSLLHKPFRMGDLRDVLGSICSDKLEDLESAPGRDT